MTTTTSTTDVSTTRRSKPRATAPAAAGGDAYAAAEQAADAFLQAVREAIEKLPATPHLDGPAGELTEALSRIGTDAGPAITAASAAVGIYWSHARAISLQARRDDAAAHLPAVAAALDQATARFERQDDLDQAHAAVAQLNAEHAEVLAELEKAVAVADVAAVLRLRPRIEVELPAAMDATHLELAELELARAEAQRARPQRRAEAAARAQRTAQGEVEQAQQCLEEAQAALQAAAVARFTAEQVAAQTAQRARHLAAEIEQLRAANARSLADRLRRLAGLPPEPPTTDHRPYEGGHAMTTPPTGATRRDAERRVAAEIAKRFSPGCNRPPPDGRPPRTTAHQAEEQLARRFPGT